MIYLKKRNKRVFLNRYLLMEKGHEIRWEQEVDKEGVVDEEGDFISTFKYHKRNGLGIRRWMHDRQVNRDRAEKEGRKKSPFNKYELKIIKTLYSHQTPLTTGKVTKYARFAYNTTKKYLRRLAEKGYVKSVHHSNAVWWWLREVEKGEEEING